MRGNLVWYGSHSVVKFEEDQDGYWELYDDGKIIPYHPLRENIEYAKLPASKWIEEGIKEYDRQKEEYVMTGKITPPKQQPMQGVEINIQRDALQKEFDIKQQSMQDNFWSDEMVTALLSYYVMNHDWKFGKEFKGEDVIREFKKEAGTIEYVKNKRTAQQSKSDTEVDYVITSYRDTTDGMLYNIPKEDKFYKPIGKNWEINSVQRKSDWEWFSVDEVTEQGKIIGFKETDNKITATAFQKGDGKMFGNCEGSTQYFLSELIKKKENTVMVDMDAKLLSVRDVIEWGNKNKVIFDEYKKYGGDVLAKNCQALIDLAKQKIK